jgi:hypothetical protein
MERRLSGLEHISVESYLRSGAVTVSLKDRRKLSGKVGTVLSTTLGVAVIVALLVVGYIAIHERFTSTGPYRIEYEGRIVDKSITITESQIGSGTARRLLIRAKNGEEFQVAINEVLYGRAQIGMWIKSSSKGAELTWAEP